MNSFKAYRIALQMLLTWQVLSILSGPFRKTYAAFLQHYMVLCNKHLWYSSINYIIRTWKPQTYTATFISNFKRFVSQLICGGEKEKDSTFICSSLLLSPSFSNLLPLVLLLSHPFSLTKSVLSNTPVTIFPSLILSSTLTIFDSLLFSSFSDWASPSERPRRRETLVKKLEQEIGPPSLSQG